ncbi:hypothetical protein ACRRTK_017498 [Alexandromys fortis]
MSSYKKSGTSWLGRAQGLPTYHQENATGFKPQTVARPLSYREDYRAHKSSAPHVSEMLEESSMFFSSPLETA